MPTCRRCLINTQNKSKATNKRWRRLKLSYHKSRSVGFRLMRTRLISSLSKRPSSRLRHSKRRRTGRKIWLRPSRWPRNHLRRTHRIWKPKFLGWQMKIWSSRKPRNQVWIHRHRSNKWSKITTAWRKSSPASSPSIRTWVTRSSL